MCAVVETPDLGRKAIIREFERTERLVVDAIAEKPPSAKPSIRRSRRRCLSRDFGIYSSVRQSER
jgi:hypothetical protein